MNERYLKMNELLKTWTKEGKQDRNILRALYSQVNLEKAHQVNHNQDLTQNTMYSTLTDRELSNMYEQDKFNNLSTKELQHLIQESHNRFMKENNCDVTRNVVVDSDKENDGVFGYVCSEDDMLFINKYMIDRAKNSSIQKDHFNQANVGKVMLFITSHESKHVVQFDNSVKFALKEDMTSDQIFSGVMAGINNTNFFIADEKQDNYYIQQWQAMYDFHFLEHEANYTATKNAERLISEDSKYDMPYYQYLAETSILGLRYMPSLTESNHGKIKTRIQKMENYIKRQLEYFEQGTQDCPLKAEMVKIVKDYIEVDEKGHSELRDRLYAEIEEMNDNCVTAIAQVRGMRNKNRKGLMDETQNEEFESQLLGMRL